MFRDLPRFFVLLVFLLITLAVAIVTAEHSPLVRRTVRVAVYAQRPGRDDYRV